MGSRRALGAPASAGSAARAGAANSREFTAPRACGARSAESPAHGAARLQDGRARRRRVRGSSLILSALLTASAGILGAGCDNGAESAPRALLELERLSFIPAAERRIPGYSHPAAECDIEEALLVDRFELTRADWLALAPEGFAPEVAARWRGDDGEVPPDTLAWPATWMNLEEARAIAERRGMRLPTTREWIFVAVGYSKLPYPWGLSAQASFCNTRELSLDRLVPVGTFESGQAPTYGLHDLMGNAMEWVADWVPGYGDYREQEPADFHPERGLTRAGEVSAMGGSYKERLRPTYDDWIRAEWLAFQADTLAPGHRAEDLGFRCVADAREYLWAHADRWGATAEARERVAAVARGWAAAVGPREVERLLEELAARDGAPPGIAWLLEGVP